MTAYTEWVAKVTISGVPVLTEADGQAMLAVVPGSVVHDTGTDELHLMWRFGDERMTVSTAMERASYTWRAALGQATGVEALFPEGMCTAFHVFCVTSSSEADEAELKRIFREET